jgi:hypothetical protein
MENNFYVYMYLREDGTPYYVGKGKEYRAYDKARRIAVPPKNRIKIVLENLTNEQACSNEIDFIKFYGRKDQGTGILRNLTDGGEGAPGRILSEESKRKLSKTLSIVLKGRTPWNKGKIDILSEQQKKSLEEGRKKFLEENGGPVNKGVAMSDEQKEKLRKASSGKKQTTETIQKRVQHYIGKPRSEETKRKISEKQRGVKRRKATPEEIENRVKHFRGKKRPIVTCPHCGKSGGSGSMHVHHFDRCKLSPEKKFR